MDISGRWILGELREMQSDANLARVDEIGNPRVGRRLGGDGSGRSEQRGHHKQYATIDYHGISPIRH